MRGLPGIRDRLPPKHGLERQSGAGLHRLVPSRKEPKRSKELDGHSGEFYNGLRPSKANAQAYDHRARERGVHP